MMMASNSDKKKVKYRICDMTTGLYQDDGYDKRLFSTEPKWSKRGKTWSKLDDLKTHLKALEEARIIVSPLWEVIESDVVAGTEVRYSATVLSTKKKSSLI